MQEISLKLKASLEEINVTLVISISQDFIPLFPFPISLQMARQEDLVKLIYCLIGHINKLKSISQWLFMNLYLVY